VYELGCGTGAHARAMAARWPERPVTAIDHSPAMLDIAGTPPIPTNLFFIEADIAGWSAPRRAALIFSNATLHWLPDHRTLFTHLMGELVPGGVLAVQMPDNFKEPSHRLIRELALAPPWRDKLGTLTEPGGPLCDDLVAAPDFYYDTLAPLASGGIDLWRTEYLTALEGERPVLEWIKGSILRPVLARLEADERPDFEDALAARLAAAYPRRGDGTTLLPFRRLFFVATR
ncbi:MAG: methyltransferase domain-containing protein, partial [Stellaceae bacterium]